MYIEDPAELGMFPEYIQKYLNGDYKSEDYPNDVIVFEPMYRLNKDKTAQEWFSERIIIHNVPKGLLDILFDKPFDNESGKLDPDFTTWKYYGLDKIGNIYYDEIKGPLKRKWSDQFSPKPYIPIADMKYPVDEKVNIQSGPSDLFKYIENNTFDMITTARKSFASAFASYCLSEDVLDDEDIADIKTTIETILKAYKPDYKDEDFNWKSPYLFPMVECIYNKLPDDKKKECEPAFAKLSNVHQAYYKVGYDEILSKTRMEAEKIYDITVEMPLDRYQAFIDRINELNNDPNLQEFRNTSETLLFIKWVLDKYEESKKLK